MIYYILSYAVWNVCKDELLLHFKWCNNLYNDTRWFKMILDDVHGIVFDIIMLYDVYDIVFDMMLLHNVYDI